MHVMIIGAAGMLGRKLTARLAAEGALAGRAITAMTLLDIVPPETPSRFAGTAESRVADLSQPGEAARAASLRPDVIFHLAAVVSGEAEADFDKGYRVNLDGTRALFEAVRHEGRHEPYRPRLVFTSSIAVFGAPFPDAPPGAPLGTIDDEFLTAPLTSYGTEKAIGELLLSDYTRRGFMDGIAIRLPTISIRPGKPNKAASSFFSGILREPLAGQEAVLPVSEEVRHWHASPRSAVGFLLRSATIDLAPLGARRALTMPGLSATVGEQIAALRRVAGEAAVKRIRREPDPVVAGIVEGWPRNFATRRAASLGFVAETSFDEIIRVHIEDELGGKLG